MSEESSRGHGLASESDADGNVNVRVDSDAITFYAHHDRESGESFVLPVVWAVSEVTGQEPTNMEPLNTVVDADALDALLDVGDDSTNEVTFRYEGCSVTVTSDGDIAIKQT